MSPNIAQTPSSSSLSLDNQPASAETLEYPSQSQALRLRRPQEEQEQDQEQVQEKERVQEQVSQHGAESSNEDGTTSSGRIFRSFLPWRRQPQRPVHINKNLPRLSQERLQRSLSDHAFDIDQELQRLHTGEIDEKQTVLYLAYGSNLCHETFQGRRGIKPIARVNVVVPELRLTFDLPGLPYVEPCFANSGRRRPPASDSSDSCNETDFLLDHFRPSKYHKDRWTKGMVGVVYEVTESDYAHIIATEGGGASYQDILATCYVLPDGDTVPESPAGLPFKAHTLLSPPQEPTHPDDPRPNSGRLRRPDPSYAQPSARYLKLLTDGADEHSLPQEYKDYLHDIRAFTITTRQQRLGRFVLIGAWVPFVMLGFSLQRAFRGKSGRSPKWVIWFMNGIFSTMWHSYDLLVKPLFGDGERTMKEHDEPVVKQIRRWSRPSDEADLDALSEKETNGAVMN